MIIVDHGVEIFMYETYVKTSAGEWEWNAFFRRPMVELLNDI